MDGTCVEMPDQRPRGETEGEPLVLSFNAEVLRIQQVRASVAIANQDALLGACTCPSELISCGAQCTLLRSQHASLAWRPQVMSSAVQVHQDITKCGQRITRHLDAWRRFSDIWKTDKAALLDKFKAKAPPCSAYEEKFSKFKKVGGARLLVWCIWWGKCSRWSEGWCLDAEECSGTSRSYLYGSIC